ncbi:MAG TPA: hypothetical protein VE263_02480 [Candidatus Angelobacter sp.]|nr:hypothetical protein [Candidatus Angelobacter sp.]
MFETPQEIKPSASKGLWAGIAVVVLVIGIGAYFFVTRASKQMPAAAASAAQPKEAADALRDLKVQRTTMNKDSTGTAVWVATIENKSPSYTYSNIQYETTYVGADNNAISVNKGAVAISIGPGEQRNAEIKDAAYPPGTAWYKFKITGATPAVQ